MAAWEDALADPYYINLIYNICNYKLISINKYIIRLLILYYILYNNKSNIM